MALLPLEVVAEVGESYLSAKNAPRHGPVIAAYEALQAETDRLFHAVLGGRHGQSVSVVFTRCPQPYASDTELIASARVSHVLEITTAAVSQGRIHPLLDCTYGGAFDRFRAVHDLIGHVQTGFGFDLDDEIAAWRVQDRLHGRLARWALATELLAVNSARSIIDEAPAHTAMLLEPELVQRSRT